MLRHAAQTTWFICLNMTASDSSTNRGHRGAGTRSETGLKRFLQRLGQLCCEAADEYQVDHVLRPLQQAIVLR